MSSASRGRRAKRSQNKSGRVQRAQRPEPQPARLDDPDADGSAADAGKASGYVAGVDPSVLADPTATRELVARRRFAVATVVTSIDGDDVELDPADEDQRELLIVAEHPQYQHVLDDPFSDELVNGVNPRLHVALHQVIANQLWEGTPPEVWQAARRLLADGHDRHAILHALAYELSQELHPTLTGQHAPDPDMTAYRARLRKL